MTKHTRAYDDLEALQQHESVTKWLQGLTEQRTALYSFARYLRWGSANGLVADPDAMIKECLDGTNRTLVEHMGKAKDFAEGPEFSGNGRQTRVRNYRNILSFYTANGLVLPRMILRVESTDRGSKSRSRPSSSLR